VPQKSYRLFISHAWSYSSDYVGVVRLLNTAPRFTYRNYSAPSSKPVVDPTTIVGQRRLRQELADQIRPVGVVLVLAGMYAHHARWIREEMRIAQGWGKPIVAVAPWGQLRVPSAVTSVADETVRWSTGSIVAAVRYWHL
jgi:hypothetical protein